ncbi:hypothetical protein [Histidinibacterium aquaticum]|uniref:Uncharacterized protein n=1 Tax=Histidinibacterium aquaticum TaxID=2613962 RepID=A0A5J5GET5_9RHOB|nr:hypothetical protein [Histidinibacterium aquaticum]KAA9006739.1 hypothetical protein F3S47_13230 [Histidinibacterium aquaticum]
MIRTAAALIALSAGPAMAQVAPDCALPENAELEACLALPSLSTQAVGSAPGLTAASRTLIVIATSALAAISEASATSSTTE